MFHLILMVAWLTIVYVPLCNSASCSSYSTQTSCGTNSRCSWYNSACICAGNTTMDISFVMDSSGSMGYNNFQIEKAFVSSMISTGITNSTNVGVIRFDTTTTAFWNFSNTQQPRTAVNNTVNNLAYPGQSTYMLDAVRCSVAQFQSSAARPWAQRLLFLITDGVPNPAATESPCSMASTLSSLNITVLIIGVGSIFQSTAVNCLVSSSSQIILVSSFSSSNFANIRNATDSFTCPSSVSVTITEVRPVGNSSDTGAFVELYNRGSTLYLIANSINITGFVTAYLTNNTLPVWSNYSYLVLYDGTSNKPLPNCRNCSCTDGDNNSTNGIQCSNAYYIKCTGITSNGGCSFSSTYLGASLSEINWGLTVYDNTDGSVVSNATYTSTFPSIWNYYSYELQSTSDATSVGSNWEQSCYQQGTPGQGPLSNCNYGCTNSNCQSGGDVNAFCSSSTTCNCSNYTAFYFYNGVCNKINPPSSCSTKIYKNDYFVQEALIAWTAPYGMGAVNSNLSYFVNYTGGTSTSTQLVLYYLYATTSDPVPQVATIYNGIYSTFIYCPFDTNAPSPVPTPSPTYAIPIIPSCTAVITGTNIYISWSSPTLTAYTPSSITSYYVYLSPNGVNSSYAASSNLYYTWTNGFVGATYSKMWIKVTPYVEDTDGSTETSLMFNAATNCTISSAAPTTIPTSMPSRPPTSKPTGRPSYAPTRTPTYSAITISSCSVSIVAGGHSFTVSYVVNSCSSSCGSLATNLNVSSLSTLLSIPNNDYTYSGGSSAYFSGASTYTLQYSSQLSPLEQSGFYSYTGSVKCTTSSTSPTNVPSKAPTTLSPTSVPSRPPTGKPSSPPTKAPTYASIAVSDCIVTLGGRNSTGYITSFDISFIEPTYNGVTTPSTSQSEYHIIWNTSSAIYYPSSSGSSYSKTIADVIITISDTVDVQIYERNSYTVTYGSAVVCTIKTLAPTALPTPSPTSLPTPSPTYADPTITIDWSSMGCTDDNSPIPACSTVASKTAFETYVTRESPTNFPYALDFHWAILDTYTFHRRLQSNITTTTAPEFEVSTNTSGDNVVYGYGQTSAGKTSIATIFTSNTAINVSGSQTFYFVISNCTVPGIYGNDKVYHCSIDTAAIAITVTSSNAQLNVNSNKKGKLPTWIWYPIAAAIALIPLLGWFGYRFYKKRKYAEEMQKLKDKELQDAEGLDNVANFGGIGDNVQFNPLATGGAQDITTGGDYIDRQLLAQKKDFTAANIDVDTQVYRQDFGPVQPNKH